MEMQLPESQERVQRDRQRRRSYAGEFKAGVLYEWLVEKKDLEKLAARYGLHPNQIKNWKTLLLKRADVALADQRSSRETRRHTERIHVPR